MNANIKNVDSVDSNGKGAVVIDGKVFDSFDHARIALQNENPDSVFIRNDLVNVHSDMLDSLYDFSAMTDHDMKVIHARSHSRIKAFDACSYCISDFIDEDEIEKNAEKKARGKKEKKERMNAVSVRFSHSSCDHENSKAARAKCRRDRRKADGTMLAEDGIEVVIED